MFGAIILDKYVLVYPINGKEYFLSDIKYGKYIWSVKIKDALAFTENEMKEAIKDLKENPLRNTKPFYWTKLKSAELIIATAQGLIWTP